MLFEKLQRLAENKIPAVLAKSGTEYVDVMRSTPTDTGYGGTEDGTPASVYGEIPCILSMRPSNATGSRWTNGEEFFDARMTIPTNFGGQIIEIGNTDSLRIAAREGANPERLYAVKEVLNKYGVYYDVGCTTIRSS